MKQSLKGKTDLLAYAFSTPDRCLPVTEDEQGRLESRTNAVSARTRHEFLCPCLDRFELRKRLRMMTAEARRHARAAKK